MNVIGKNKHDQEKNITSYLFLGQNDHNDHST